MNDRAVANRAVDGSRRLRKGSKGICLGGRPQRRRRRRCPRRPQGRPLLSPLPRPPAPAFGRRQANGRRRHAAREHARVVGPASRRPAAVRSLGQPLTLEPARPPAEGRGAAPCHAAHADTHERLRTRPDLPANPGGCVLPIANNCRMPRMAPHALFTPPPTFATLFDASAGGRTGVRLPQEAQGPPNRAAPHNGATPRPLPDAPPRPAPCRPPQRPGRAARSGRRVAAPQAHSRRLHQGAQTQAATRQPAPSGLTPYLRPRLPANTSPRAARHSL